MDSTACIHLRTGVQVAMIWREALDSIQLPFPPHPFLNRQNCRPIPSSSRSNRTLTAQYQFLQVPNSPLPFSTLPKHFQFQIQRKWLQKKQKRCAGNPRESNFNSFVESYENFFGGTLQLSAPAIPNQTPKAHLTLQKKGAKCSWKNMEEEEDDHPKFCGWHGRTLSLSLRCVR